MCGYPPQTVNEILGKVLSGRSILVPGRMQIAPGLIIHPAFRAHTCGSQLLQVNTRRGQFVFGGGAYSSWEGLRDWNVANIQQTDTIQQFLAYEKCYVLTSTQNSFNNRIAENERLSYSTDYRSRKTGGRFPMAIALALPSWRWHRRSRAMCPRT